MRKLLAAVCFFVISTGTSQAAGCLKGAAAGAAAGHLITKHPIIGAGVGCLVGRHMAKKADLRAMQDANVMRQPIVKK
jgi:uncharacterized membrane protein